MNIEDVLCSKTRMKILNVLMHSYQLNVSEIARRVGANYTWTGKHLKILEDEGILTYRMFGSRICLYKFNELSPKAKAVQKLIEAFGHIIKHKVLRDCATYISVSSHEDTFQTVR